MSLPFSFGVEKILEAYPVEPMGVHSLLFIIFSILAFPLPLSFLPFLQSIYHVLCTRCVIGSEVRGKPDISPYSRSFHRRGDKTLLPFILLAFLLVRISHVPGDSAGGAPEVTSCRQVSHSAQVILRCLGSH
ncbi:hypothetical protein HJG60_008492 [Phyllostomus discolor]|uniref:Uncharacterized protein n=1 Tax=Phyllostomus discolor TaxID=89673 RepID=A0A833Z789_9CHIR|nr:hypothetical protein HJG60_008492 [Phyllostomus discolor]